MAYLEFWKGAPRPVEKNPLSHTTRVFISSERDV